MRYAPSFAAYLQRSVAVLDRMTDTCLSDSIDQAVACIVGGLQQQHPLLVCGNGGSASDAMHITAELVGRFSRHRAAFPVYCLSAHAPFLTAWSNDCDPQTVFARQLEAYAQNGAVLWTISTSGRSQNVVVAARMAQSLQVPVVTLTGGDGGELKALSDIAVVIPEHETALIQQAHQCVYHYMCAQIEATLARPSTLDPQPEQSS